MPVKCAMRDAMPFSLFFTSASQSVSFLRRMKRSTFRPQVFLSPAENRSCDNGIRSSALQPRSSVDTAECHTPSHVWSVHESL